MAKIPKIQNFRVTKLVIAAGFENLKSSKVISRKIRVAAIFWTSQCDLTVLTFSLGSFLQLRFYVKSCISSNIFDEIIIFKWIGILRIRQFWKYSRKQISENILSRQSWISFPIWSLSKILFFFQANFARFIHLIISKAILSSLHFIWLNMHTTANFSCNKFWKM